MKRFFGLLILLIMPAFMLGYLLQSSGGTPDADSAAVQSPPSIPPTGTTGSGTPKTSPSKNGEKSPSPGDLATNPDGLEEEPLPPEDTGGTIPDIPPDVTPDGTVPQDTTDTEEVPDTTGTIPDTGTGTTTTTGNGTTKGTTIPTTGTGTTKGTTIPTTGTGTGTIPTTGAGTGTTGGTKVPTVSTTTSADSNMLQFDFRNTTLDLVVRYFASQVNKNFIIPKTLNTSSVTIIIGRPIPKEQAFEVLKTILAEEQWSLYEDDNFVRIQKQGTPPDKAMSTPVVLIKGIEEVHIKKSDTTTTAIIVLNYISAQEIQNILAPMRSPASVMQAFTRINALFIRDSERNIEYILSIIEKLDQPGTSGGKITMVKLQYSIAAEIAQTLSLVLQANAIEAMDIGGVPPPPGGAARQPGARGAAGAKNIIPDKRTNMLIIIATEKETEALMNLISELDTAQPQGEWSVHTYQCNNQKAEDLAKILGDFVDKRPPVQAVAGQPPIPQSLAGMPQIEFFFIADKVTNSLIIQAPPQEWPLYREILKNLDQPQRQALIEVWIVEVSSTEDQTLGVEIIPSDLPPNDRIGPLQNEIFGASGSGSSAKSIFGGATSSTDGSTTTPSLGTGASIGIRTLTATEISIDGRKVRIPNFDTFIRAIKSRSNVKVLASPKLVTLNNKEATVNITDEISIETGEVTDLTGGGGVVTTSKVRKEVGILMTLTPQINADDFVIMELKLEISNVVGELTSDPTIARRTTNGSVRCENKQTIVISGLRRQNKTATKTGVPLLMDIPIVGRLFSTKINNNINTNLLIFITPHIVTDTLDMVAMTGIMKGQRLENEEDRFTIVGKGGKTSKQSGPKVIWNH